MGFPNNDVDSSLVESGGHQPTAKAPFDAATASSINAPSGAPTTAPALNERGAPSLIQVAFPQAANIVFFTALAFGLFVALFPLVLRGPLSLDASAASFLLCTGVATCLAAFGGQATFRVGGSIAAGAAAIAGLLFWQLEDSREKREVRDLDRAKVAAKRLLQGTIDGIDARKYEPSLRTNRPLMGVLDHAG